MTYMSDRVDMTTEALREEIENFRDDFRTVVMATVSEDGVPDASYAPYIRDSAGRVYVYISGLSRHTRNLQANRQVSLLFIEAERQAQNVFARKRLNYICDADLVDRASADWAQVLDRFTARFGAFINTIRQLADFQLFCLTPKSGTYVRGFGQAFDLEGPGCGEIRHLRP
jgi:putative heme iron utilization protein